MIRTFLFVVFISVLRVPVDGAEKSIGRPSFESRINCEWHSLGQTGRGLSDALITAEYQQFFFNANEFALKPAVILFTEDPDENPMQLVAKHPLSYLLTCIASFLGGYLVRHLISLRRRKRVKEAWQAGAKENPEHAEGVVPGSLSPGPAPKMHPFIQQIADRFSDNSQKKEEPQKDSPSVTSVSGNTPPTTTPQNKNTQMISTPEKEGAPEVDPIEKRTDKEPPRPLSENAPDEKAIVKEWDRDDIYNKTRQFKSGDPLYFPNPNIDGDFRKADGRESYIEGTSIYKFKLVSETRAKFEFCQQRTSVNMALNNRNALILSVAEELNAYDASAYKIEIADNKYGDATLDGAIWKVTSKAKIRYVK